jgi:hypothetical protein
MKHLQDDVKVAFRGLSSRLRAGIEQKDNFYIALKHLDRSSAKEYLPFKPKSKGASGCTPPIPAMNYLRPSQRGLYYDKQQ